MESNTPRITFTEQYSDMTTEISINYDAIRALNANGYNVESEDGQTWRIVTDYKQRLAISYHINHNGTMSGPYNPDGTKQRRP